MQKLFLGGLLVGLAVAFSAEARVSASLTEEQAADAIYKDIEPSKYEKREVITPKVKAKVKKEVQISSEPKEKEITVKEAVVQTTEQEVAKKKNEEVKEAKEAQKAQEAQEENILMSKKEMRELQRKGEIAQERLSETNPFKKKAIQNTEAREKKYEEIIKKKQEKESRYQKAAREKAEQKKEKHLKENEVASKSRFTEEAKKRAEERAKKREEQNKRLKRNQKK